MVEHANSVLLNFNITRRLINTFWSSSIATTSEGLSIDLGLFFPRTILRQGSRSHLHFRAH